MLRATVPAVPYPSDSSFFYWHPSPQNVVSLYVCHHSCALAQFTIHC